MIRKKIKRADNNRKLTRTNKLNVSYRPKSKEDTRKELRSTKQQLTTSTTLRAIARTRVKMISVHSRIVTVIRIIKVKIGIKTSCVLIMATIQIQVRPINPTVSATRKLRRVLSDFWESWFSCTGKTRWYKTWTMKSMSSSRKVTFLIISPRPSSRCSYCHNKTHKTIT